MPTKRSHGNGISLPPSRNLARYCGLVRRRNYGNFLGSENGPPVDMDGFKVDVVLRTESERPMAVRIVSS